MYKINRDENKIQRLEQKSFSELGFRERDHLQEWIAKEPMALGEELLIIQKEFAGFSETQERLDLLALDKEGSLVIIENKLDDSGRDVTWQALKYASYCSTLSKDEVRSIYQDYLLTNEQGADAKEKLSDFFDGDYEEITLNRGVTQRIILVAANFRKEVTSTVLWLLNYNIMIQCFRATPFAMGDELFLNVEQVIPTPDAEDYMIGMASKVQEDVESKQQNATRQLILKEFSNQLLNVMNERSPLFQNIGSSKYSWIGTSSGVRGIGFNFAAGKRYGRAEVYIDLGTTEENESFFNKLLEQKSQIETEFGAPLEWERLEGKRACRIKTEIDGNIYVEEERPKMIDFMTKNMVELARVFRPILEQISQARR